MMSTYDFALSKINGEYFTFCDCDDYFIENGKALQFKEMIKNNYDFTVSEDYRETEGFRELISPKIMKIVKIFEVDEFNKLVEKTYNKIYNYETV